MRDFKPPKTDPFVMAVCKRFLFLELWRSQVEVVVADDGLQRFKQLAGEHAVVVCNHSNQYDPEVLFAFAKMADEEFHFLAAREVFNWVFGSVGWWFQSLGCYSVLRGGSDVDSFEATRVLIAEGKRKVVMFPEGEVSRRPDFLMPLRSGSTRLFFEAQQRLLHSKEKVQGRPRSEPVLVQPLGIRWHYKHNIVGWLDFIMRRIEERLALRSTGAGLVQRVQTAAAAMLSILEAEYRCPSRADLPYEERVYQLREHLLQQLSPLLNVARPENGSHFSWLRRALNAIHEYADADTARMSTFQRHLHRRQAGMLDENLRDCRRVQQLLGVEPPLAPRPLTQERIAAMVSIIERQVFGFVTPKGPRVATVAVGQPISMLDYWDLYVGDQQQAVEVVTEKMATEMQRLIDQLDRSIEKVSSGDTASPISRK